MRAGIVLLTRDGVGAIERVRDGTTYHVLPGGRRRLLGGWLGSPVVFEEV